MFFDRQVDNVFQVYELLTFLFEKKKRKEFFYFKIYVKMESQLDRIEEIEQKLEIILSLSNTHTQRINKLEIVEVF